MRTNIAIWLAAVLLTACQSTPTGVYKSLAITATSVDAAMKAFADAVVAGKVSQPVQDKVRAAHGRYSLAMQAAIKAARFDASSVTPAEVQRLANDVLTLIVQAVGKETP